MNRTSAFDFSQILPLEMSLEIFKHLNVKDLVICSRVSHLFRIIAQHNVLWEEESKIFNYKRENDASAYSLWSAHIKKTKGSASQKAYAVGCAWQDKNNKLAEQWLIASSRLGYTPAIMSLEKMAEEGGRKEEAGNWNKLHLLLADANQVDKAIAHVLSDATFTVAKKFADKYDPDFKHSYVRSFEYLKRAASHLHLEAIFWLGCAYYEGHGIEQSIEKALEYWDIAADQGHTDAQFLMGRAYYLGEGVDPSHKEAMKYLKAASKQNHPMAQNLLAHIKRENPNKIKKIVRTRLAVKNKGTPSISK
jgi:TPR repeat protein